MDQDIKQRFDELKENWCQATINMSKTIHIIGHPSYEEIIEMGEHVVPLIIEELRKERESGKGFRIWFFALQKITGINPLSKLKYTSVEELAEWWINWSTKNLNKKGSKVEQAV